MKVLDYCAGGGGKTLAMAAQARLKLLAHDVNPGRMADLPVRALRAGIKVALIGSPETQAPYDLVLIDAPCSGSGSWRRDPEGKWRLTAETLDRVQTTQAAILDQVAPMVRGKGWVAYATCSLLHRENRGQVDAFFSRHPDWRLQSNHVFTPLQGGDGFYLALLQRN